MRSQHTSNSQELQTWFAPAILALSDEEFEEYFKQEPGLEDFRVLLETARIKKRSRAFR